MQVLFVKELWVSNARHDVELRGDLRSWLPEVHVGEVRVRTKRSTQRLLPHRRVVKGIVRAFGILFVQVFFVGLSLAISPDRQRMTTSSRKPLAEYIAITALGTRNAKLRRVSPYRPHNVECMGNLVRQLALDTHVRQSRHDRPGRGDGFVSCCHCCCLCLLLHLSVVAPQSCEFTFQVGVGRAVGDTILIGEKHKATTSRAEAFSRRNRAPTGFPEALDPL